MARQKTAGHSFIPARYLRSGLPRLRYPVELDTVRICLWDGWPDSNHEEFGIKVFDDDGSGGAPGTLLGTVLTTATTFGWWEADISSLGITIESDDFYIAYHTATTLNPTETNLLPHILESLLQCTFHFQFPRVPPNYQIIQKNFL